MMKTLNTILSAMLLMIIVACGGLKTNTAYRGIVYDDDKITLDGDTFSINERINDTLLIVCNYPDYKAPYYLIKREWTGFYYVQIEADSISTIANTSNLVGIDNKKVYDIAKGIEFPLSCDMSYLCYLGQWKNLLVFTNQDSIYFSDGRSVELQDDAYCNEIVSNSGVTLTKGARVLNVSFEQLHNLKHIRQENDNSIARFRKSYYLIPRFEGESDNIGFGVDLEMPKENSEADDAIRKWMIGAIKDDAFSLLGIQKDLPVGNYSPFTKFENTLDNYGVLWEKLCRNIYQEPDTLDFSMNCDIRVRKVVDCNDYVTYYYYASIYSGGLHEMPRSYYITYDKKRHLRLSASNTIKPSMMNKFRKVVLNHLKAKYDADNGERSKLKDYAEYAFSFHQPIIETDSLDDVMESFLIHEYMCDEWSGWGAAESKAFTFENFPLPHFALLPEGVVISYHPYQIDCFAAGEYHAVIPYSEIKSYLKYDYHEDPDLCPRLEQFVKCK